MSDLSLPEFLTFEEVVEVDRALLTAQDKFLTRVSLYSLRVLKQIAAQDNLPIEAITDQQIADWIGQDETLRQAIGTDPAFQSFFTQIVLSSLKHLQHIAQETGIVIEALTIPQVVAWSEQQAKHRLDQTSSFS